MIDPERIKLTLTCESCPEQYQAYVDDWPVGYVRLGHGWLSVWFPSADGEQLFHDRVSSGSSIDDDERDEHLAKARRLIAERLDRVPVFQVGQRVRYEIGPSGTCHRGEGTIVRLPLLGGYFPAGWCYRVRHDGGTETRYVELGVLEHELTLVELDSARASRS